MKFWQVDAFTDTPFKGNPAAVFILRDELSPMRKQLIAAEMNLSETVFVVLNDRPSISWFTPTNEVDLCGHATLAAAHILWSENFIDQRCITFDSLSGPVSVTQSGDLTYTLDFPVQPPKPTPIYNSEIHAILGCPALFIGSSAVGCVVHVEEREQVIKANVDLDKIAALPEIGVLLTARAEKDSSYDYIYRAFFPRVGISEDPVTGSANCALAPYWSSLLGKNELSAYQASSRGGQLRLMLGLHDRVLITGTAVTIFDATLRV